jgi:hypothetical protein
VSGKSLPPRVHWGNKKAWCLRILKAVNFQMAAAGAEKQGRKVMIGVMG